MGIVGLPQLGGCVCGAVHCRLNEAPLLAYACHCHDCQTRSGSAFALTLVARAGALVVTGELEVLRLSTQSGREIDHHLCKNCRVRLFAVAPLAPDFLSLRVGTLADASWVVPIAQTWVESAIPWAIIPNVRSIAPADFDFVALGLEWQANSPRFEAR